MNGDALKVTTDNDSRWQRVLLLSLGLLLMGAVTGTVSRWVGNTLVFDGTTGDNAFAFDVDGLRGDFGTGADDTIESDGTNLVTPTSFISLDSLRFSNALLGTAGVRILDVGVNSETQMRGNVSNTAGRTAVLIGSDTTLTAGDDRFIMKWYRDTFTTLVASMSSGGYLASTTPHTLDSIYVNNLLAALTYGGRDLPAHAFTFTSIAFRIRAAGATGSTDNTFVITGSGASTGVCNCTFACNSAIGDYSATCSGGSGVGCAFAASTDIAYSFTIGDCATPTDIVGNISVEGIWQ